MGSPIPDDGRRGATGHLVIPPDTAILGSLSAWLWHDDTPAGLVGFMFIAHRCELRPGDVPQVVEARMRGLAAALDLAGPSAPLPDIGTRLRVKNGAVLVRVDHQLPDLRVPTHGPWNHFVADGGPVVLAIGLDTLSPTAAVEYVERHVISNVTAGRVLVGKTCAGQGPRGERSDVETVLGRGEQCTQL